MLTHVVFAVLDRSGDTIGEFEQVFGPATMKTRLTKLVKMDDASSYHADDP